MALLDESTVSAHHGNQQDEIARRSVLPQIEPERLEAFPPLEVEHASKQFREAGGFRLFSKNKQAKPKIRALDDVSLTIQRREIFGVLGANGSGKSTLIRLISTLLIPDAGAVRVFGHDVLREQRTVQRLINRVSVEAAFFRKLSPMENLLYSARLYGISATEARQLIHQLLIRLGIGASRIGQPLESMSRGMQQKVAIARAFLTAPILLLLDEPTTGLDPRSKQDVQVFVRELRDTHDATILLTTHDMDEAEALCDRIAILDGGRIVAQGTPAELCAAVGRELGFDHPATLTDVFMAYTGRDLTEEEDLADD